MDKVKVGILGLGRGRTHLHNMLQVEEAQVIAVADRYPSRREREAELLASHGVQVVQEYDDLLALQPDAVVVASNGRMQAQHSIQALEAGCHVLSEVPGAFTEQEFIHLRDAVQRTGKTYMLAENACYWDFFRYWRRWVAEGRFGPISIAEGEYLHYLPGTLVAPDSTGLTPSEAREQGRTDAVPTWRADQPPIQYLTHDLGPLLEVLNDRVVSVSCRSGPWRCQEAPLRSDGQIALFETAGGILIKIMVTLNTRLPSEHRYRLLGVEGSVEYFMYERFCRRMDRFREEAESWESLGIDLAARDDDTSTGHGGADIKVSRHFCQALLEGRPAPIDIYRSIEYSLPGIIAARSAELGGAPLPVPDLRPAPFSGTIFWDALGLPETDPPGETYQSPQALTERE